MRRASHIASCRALKMLACASAAVPAAGRVPMGRPEWQGALWRSAAHGGAARRSTTSRSARVTGLDKQLQDNCRNGLFYGSSSRVDCNDLKTLRQQWQIYRLEQETDRAELLRRAEWNRALRGR